MKIDTLDMSRLFSIILIKTKKVDSYLIVAVSFSMPKIIILSCVNLLLEINWKREVSYDNNIAEFDS